MRYNAQKLGGAEKHKEISNGIEIYAQGMRYSLSVLYNILRTAEEMLFNRRSASIFSDELLSISRIPWNSATVLEPSYKVTSIKKEIGITRIQIYIIWKDKFRREYFKRL